MPTSLTLDTARGNDGELVLTASGEIDLSNIEAFTAALSMAMNETVMNKTTGPRRTLTVDLSAVNYLDSAAINALFNHAERIHLIAEPRLIRLFNISGLAELTTMESAPPATGR